MIGRFRNYSIGVVCLLVLLASVQTYAAGGRVAGKIPEKKIAALKEELPDSRKRISSVRKRRAYKNIVSEGKSLLKRYSDAPNRFEVLGVMLKSQRLLLAMESSVRNRKELISICKQVSNAPAEYAVIRLDADMMLMDEQMTRENADFNRRAEALTEIIKRYRGTAAEVTSLKIGALIAPKIEAFELESQIIDTMDERFAGDLRLIEWRQKKIGISRIELLLTGEYERKDGVKMKFPFDRMGHDCLMVIWSQNNPGYKEYLTKVEEMQDKYPDQFEMYSFNVDQLSDCGESILKELGFDWNAMRLPGGRKSQFYRTYAGIDPVALLFNGYGRMVRTPQLSDGQANYARYKWLIMDRRVSENRLLKQLQSLFIGDYLVVGLDGSIDPALPPELKMVSFKNDDVIGDKLTRSAESVPVETLKAIQACFTPGVLRFRIKSVDAMANYTKAEKLCSAAIRQYPKAPDLWIVRNRRIIALLGMWNLSGDPKYIQLAADQANIAMKAKLPPAAMVVPRFCLVKYAIRQGSADAELLVSAMVRDLGGEDAPASVYAAASILALDAYSKELHGLYRGKFISDSYNSNPQLYSFVSFLRNRYHQRGLLAPNYSRHEARGRGSFRGYIIDHRSEPITDRLPHIELRTLDGKTLSIPEDTNGKVTLLVFVEPPMPVVEEPVVEKVEDNTKTKGGKKNKTKKKPKKKPKKKNLNFVMERAHNLQSRHIHNELNVIAAFLYEDPNKIDAVIKDEGWTCQAAIVPGGLTNPMLGRLGVYSADSVPNVFLLRRDGTMQWRSEGYRFKAEYSNDFSIYLAMKVHIEVVDSEFAYKALKSGDFKEARRVFSGPFLPEKDERFRWAAPRFHGRALANIGLKDFQAALEDINTAIDSHEKTSFHAKDRPCEGLIEMLLTKAAILDELGKTDEAKEIRKRGSVKARDYGKSIYDLFHDKLKETSRKLSLWKEK